MTEGSLLARHFRMPSFFSGKRARMATAAAAGTLTLATVVSAAAGVLPATTAAASPSTAASSMTAFDHRQVVAAHPVRTADMATIKQVAAFDHMRAVAAERHAKEVAASKAAKAAAAKAAAHKAAVHKAALAKLAAAEAHKAAAHPVGSPRQIAKQMLGQLGWQTSQFSCLEPLWYHESGWNPSAMNPSSGAYGIPQALHGSLMASAGSDWRTNPATQIRWGLTYIHDRYGSPCGAWAHEQSANWY
jgi:transglycosylase-like protein with SLT domain